MTPPPRTPTPPGLPDGQARRIASVLALLVAANIAAWCWSIIAFRGSAALLGTALLAWGYGLRHAVDADHIAAIDNVTRRLMQENQRPVGIGLFFSLGHSTVVVLACLTILLFRNWFRLHLGALAGGGALAGTAISAGFLLLIGGCNLWLLAALLRRRAPEATAPQGILSRLLFPLFRRIGGSGGMFWLGLLFGLGFDTATEVGVLSLAATTGASHLHVGWSVLALPALFAAGMSLVDTLDGILMLGAYGLALDEPSRRRGYNIAITAASVLVAFGVGLAEVLGQFGTARTLPAWVTFLNDHAETVGALAVAGFALLWATALGARALRTRAT